VKESAVAAGHADNQDALLRLVDAEMKKNAPPPSQPPLFFRLDRGVRKNCRGAPPSAEGDQLGSLAFVAAARVVFVAIDVDGSAGPN